MKLGSHSNTLESNVQGETQNFGIGDASVIIEILRNRLYEHKVRTLVQEYICNGRDAMREVNNTVDKLEVTIPTSLSPVFKVRDYGPGITPERMANVFVNYGASTKRGTNNQTGGFGIGAKSAWSYTDSFTITTFVDGVKRSYVAHTGVNNNGRLDHVSTTTTDEKNGTEIQVPVQLGDFADFRDAVYRATYFWQDRPVYKGTTDVAPELISGLRLSPMVEIVSGSLLPSQVGPNQSNVIAVIDGVVYPVYDVLQNKADGPFRTLRNLVRNGMRVIFHIGNGVVEVSASREAIADSKHTVAALDKMAREAVRLVREHLKAEWEKVTNTTEFFETYRRLKDEFDVSQHSKFDEYQISGGALETKLFHNVHMEDINMRGRYGRKTSKLKRDDMKYNKKISIDNIDCLFFLEGTDTQVRLNKRFREFLQKRDNLYIITPMTKIVTPAVRDDKGDIVTPAVHETDMASYNKLKADLGVRDLLALTWTETPRTSTPRSRVVRDKSEIYISTPSKVSGDRHTYVNLESDEGQYLFVPTVKNAWPEGYDSEKIRELSLHLEAQDKPIIVCGLNEKAVAKVAGKPNFRPLADFLTTWKPSAKEMAYVKCLAAENTEKMKHLVAIKGLKDSFVARMAKHYRYFATEKSKDALESIPEMLKAKVEETSEYKLFVKYDKKLETYLEKSYPLLYRLRDWEIEDMKGEVEIYMNAKWKFT